MNSILVTCPICAGQVVVSGDGPGHALECQQCGGAVRPPCAPASQSSFVIFDLETTGLSPYADEIIQIAGLRLVNGTLRESEFFATYVNPGVPIPPFITAYTGITNAHVSNAPPVREALRQFAAFVGDSALIAHNGHRFDMRFIRAACEKTNLPTRSVDYFDSLGFSWKLWGRTRGTRHGLDKVLDRLGIRPGVHRRHDARGDVQLLGLAVQQMWARLSADFQQPPIRRYAGVIAATAGPEN